MILRPIAALCTAGDCPTVYATDRDTLIVQGYAVMPEKAGVELPDGELLVEIPRKLLEIAAQDLS